MRLLLLLLAAACAASAQQQLAGTATFFNPSNDSPGACMYPAGTPTGWVGQAALSTNSSLAVQVRRFPGLIG